MIGTAACWETGEHTMISSFRPRIRPFGKDVMPAGAPGVLGKVLNCSEILLKTGHHLQRLAGLGVGAPGDFDALLGLRWHRHLLGEFRASRELAEPDAEARMQPGDRIATEREPVGVDEPGDVEHAERCAEQIRLVCQPLLQGVEIDAEFLRRRFRLNGSSRIGRSNRSTRSTRSNGRTTMPELTLESLARRLEEVEETIVV